VGQPLLYVDSRGRVSLAINQGNFAQANKVAVPGIVFIPKKGAARKAS
jgi:hypothetical protein